MRIGWVLMVVGCAAPRTGAPAVTAAAAPGEPSEAGDAQAAAGADEEPAGIDAGGAAGVDARGCPTGGLIRPEPTAPARGARYVVDVADYLTLRPVAGVAVRAVHHTACDRRGGCRPTHAHPQASLTREAVTGDDGRAVLDLPDLSYAVDLPPGAPEGYLDYSPTYQLGARRCHELTRESFVGAPGVAYQVAYLVPTSLLAVSDAAQAAAAAERVPELRAWLDAHPDAVRTVAGGGAVWQVGYGTGERLRRSVRVNAFDGSAVIDGRWP